MNKEWADFWFRDYYWYNHLYTLMARTPLHVLKYDCQAAAWFWSQEW